MFFFFFLQYICDQVVFLNKNLPERDLKQNCEQAAYQLSYLALCWWSTYQLSYLALCWWSTYCVNIFVWDASQKPYNRLTVI